MSTQISTVRFGVFVQDRVLKDWEWQAVERLRRDGATCLFVRARTGSTPSSSSVARVLDCALHWVAGVLIKSCESIDRLEPERYQPSAVYRPEDQTLSSHTSGSGAINGGLKFILFFGAGEIPEGLPGCAEFGVWRFTRSSGAASEYPFIRGLHLREDVVSFGLEQFNGHDGHRGRPLLNGHFRARGERNLNISRQILAEASRWPLRVLKHVLLNGELPDNMENSAVDCTQYSAFRLLLSLLLRDALVQLTSRLACYFLLETWNVGFVRMSFQALLSGTSLSDVTLLPRRALGHYIADPFILSTTPELTLLAEDYTDFGVGRISEVTVRDPFGTPEVGLEVRLESHHHMSYPFLFRENGITYCLPECHQSNASVLYRYDAGKLTPVTDLIPGARATDGTILLHEGRYWLFCGLEDDNDQVNLHLFFSDTLDGVWSAHPLNPVKTDVRSSRSAGPIIVQDGVLFRPTQDCSRSYGHGLSINRIDCLTVTRFTETVVASIGPEAISGTCRGLHTLSFAGDLMVIDAKFNLVGLEPLLVRALRLIRRLNPGVARAAGF